MKGAHGRSTNIGSLKTGTVNVGQRPYLCNLVEVRILLGKIGEIELHHKRRRPKNTRAGCLMCKPWKMNGWKPKGIEGGHEKHSDSLRKQAMEAKEREYET